ncbi:MAG: ShlB/FhaC/HecB family hemolysin secretion/activation protein [Victivallales bacterium]|nr:ShlB/FhaC/HecB family hemolysin secretion/activation protein [Victivallales bacterium]
MFHGNIRRAPLQRLCGVVLLFASLIGWSGEDSLLRFREIRVEGDSAVVHALPIWSEWSAELLSRPHTLPELEAQRVRLLEVLYNAGYLFTQVEFPDDEWPGGVLVVRVESGQLGEIRVRKAGRYYTPRQVIAKLSGRSPGFNYAEFCRRLAKLNAGDLKVDVTLKPVYRNGSLAVDAEVDYTDRLPVHGSLEILNATAKEAKSPMQLRLGVQVQNLARCDDTLSLHYITNGDIAGEVNAGYGTYRLPMGERWVWTAFGSWSDSTYSEVVQGLDIHGRGVSYGMQLEHELYANGRVRATAAMGWRVARTRNRLRLFSQTLELGSATVSMPFLTLGYSEGGLDRWNGCNQASLTLSGNSAGQLGASCEKSFRAEGRGADGTFWQARLAMARLQRLFVGEECPGRWSLWVRLQGLYTNDAAPNAVREYLGGFESVRGYQEAEVSGDSLWAGTLEIRTPLLENRRPNEESAFGWLPGGRLIGILFMDFGWMKNHKDGNLPENGRRHHRNLVSIGGGLRLVLHKGLHGAVDYAMPLNRDASPDTPTHGRWHFALQLQF